MLPPPPLRTVRASFDAHGSSTDKPRVTGAGRVSVATTFTVLKVANVHPQRRCRAAPVAQGYSLFNGTSCSHDVPLSRDSAPHVEVCPLARGMMLSKDSIPIRPITGRLSLVPRSPTRSPLGSPCGGLSQQCNRPLLGGLQAYHVPRECPCGLGLASPPVVQHLRWVS